MHDDADEMTQLHDQLNQALEQQAEIRERQVAINAKLDVLIETLIEVLATYDDGAQIEDIPEVETIQ